MTNLESQTPALPRHSPLPTEGCAWAGGLPLSSAKRWGAAGRWLRAGASVPKIKHLHWAQAQVVHIALVVLAIAVLVVPVPLTWAAPQERHVRIEASRFQFTPSVISVNPGDKVTIDLTSIDVVHGLYVDDYGVSTTVEPGQTTRLTFVADKAGTFALRCFAPCGPLHPFMVGKLNVGPNWLLWRAVGVASIAAFAGFWMLRK